jgi:hypothetical protein
MWNVANKMSKEWCNAVQDLPLPTFEGQMNLMKIMISGARNGEVVVFGNFTLYFIQGKYQCIFFYHLFLKRSLPSFKII